MGGEDGGADRSEPTEKLTSVERHAELLGVRSGEITRKSIAKPDL
jgi:hypothetical protein